MLQHNPNSVSRNAPEKKKEKSKQTSTSYVASRMNILFKEQALKGDILYYIRSKHGSLEKKGCYI